MKRDKSRLRQELKRTEQARASSVEKILRERGPLRRGAFVAAERKCGKSNCHCAKGRGHPANYLSIKQDGKTRMVFVPASVETNVAEEAGRYRRFRQARAQLAKLARHSLTLIDELERALETSDQIPETPTRKTRRAPCSKLSRHKGSGSR